MFQTPVAVAQLEWCWLDSNYQKTPRDEEFLFFAVSEEVLDDADFDAFDGFAREGANFARSVGNDTIFIGVDSEVAAELCAGTSALSETDLTNDYLTNFC